MEPRPKGFDPSEQYAWLNAARMEYRPTSGPQYTETSFSRGNASIEILDEILPELPTKANILLIGLGVDAEPVQCCYAPFKIAASLEAKQRDYAMTLVDADEAVIADVTNRDRLYITKGIAKVFNDSWKNYLKDTRQKERIIYELEEGLRFSDYLMHESFYGSYLKHLKKGVISAEIPKGFREKRISGDIKIVHSDIAVANITDSALFHYVEFTNVLYLMHESGQKVALANVCSSMAPGARMLVNDIGGYAGRPLFPEFKGWLDEEKMKQLGIEIEDVISKKDTSKTVIFKKV